MHIFTDKTGEKWNLDLNIGTAKRLSADCGVNLLDALKVKENSSAASEIERIAEDPELLVNVLYSLCQDQVKEKNLSDFDFGCRFDGAAIENASDALMEEIINFSPPMRKKALTKIYQMSRNLMGEMEGKVDKILESEDFQKEVKALFSESFINTQESSE